MGPRLRSRGIEFANLDAVKRLTLQWGRDFAVAESRQFPMAPSAASRLQWGRDFAVAESRLHRELARPLAEASMGPRLRSRGIIHMRGARTGFLSASMGPRLRSRGILVDQQSKNGAAVPASMGPRLRSRGIRQYPCAAGVDMAQLQWGRDFAVAESRRYHGGALRGARFNGAATSQSRNRRGETPARRPANSFNGAATSQSRNHGATRAPRSSNGCFNGAATSQSRNPMRSPRPTDPSECFNGAATSQSRNPCRRASGRSPSAGFNGAATSQSRNRASTVTGSNIDHLRFNGAATSQSRNPAGDVACVCNVLGFNGAATSQSRNRALTHGHDAQATASMGPRLRSRGIVQRPGRPDCGGAASMGPRLRSRGIALARAWRMCVVGCFNGAATSQSRNLAPR